MLVKFFVPVFLVSCVLATDTNEYIDLFKNITTQGNFKLYCDKIYLRKRFISIELQIKHVLNCRVKYLSSLQNCSLIWHAIQIVLDQLHFIQYHVSKGYFIANNLSIDSFVSTFHFITSKFLGSKILIHLTVGKWIRRWVQQRHVPIIHETFRKAK